MKKQDNGLPRLKNSQDGLGVRLKGPHADIQVDAAGNVAPGAGGMSVNPSIRAVPDHLKPPEHDGHAARFTVFVIDEASFGPNLAVVQDREDHANVEPAAPCPADDYVAALRSTRPHWSPV
jgi:hypothetical protein